MDIKKMNNFTSNKTSEKMLNIESERRLSSKSIGHISDSPLLLKEYLESSIKNTFSELLFRLTHEIYTEKKAEKLWIKIKSHRESLTEHLKRDVGIVVAALDYLYNISKDIKNPKIMDDSKIEAAANLATRDKLTGLYRRDVFDYTLPKIANKHKKNKQPLSLLIMDVDNFKAINDKLGHNTGDDVLKFLGNIILDSTRKGDFPCRYGGDEFAIILPFTHYNNAILLADKLTDNISKNILTDFPQVTVSTGVSTLKECIATGKELFIQADIELYKKKKAIYL